MNTALKINIRVFRFIVDVTVQISEANKLREYFIANSSKMPNKKVCVIGAGPSGMSFMCWAAKFAREGRKVPEVTCFEKQSNWGGLWNYSWRTGTDENGEPVHGSMYR